MFRYLWRLCRSWFSKSLPQDVDDLKMRMRDIEMFLSTIYGPWFETRGFYAVLSNVNRWGGSSIALYRENELWKWGAFQHQTYIHWSDVERKDWERLIQAVPVLLQKIHTEQELDHQRLRTAQTTLEENFLLPQLNVHE